MMLMNYFDMSLHINSFKVLSEINQKIKILLTKNLRLSFIISLIYAVLINYAF